MLDITRKAKESILGPDFKTFEMCFLVLNGWMKNIIISSGELLAKDLFFVILCEFLCVRGYELHYAIFFSTTCYLSDSFDAGLIPLKVMLIAQPRVSEPNKFVVLYCRSSCHSSLLESDSYSGCSLPVWINTMLECTVLGESMINTLVGSSQEETWFELLNLLIK